MFKLGIGNDLRISYKWHGFGLKGQKSTSGLGLTAIRRGFELYECLLVCVQFQFNSVLTQIHGWLLIFCHQRHYFQLKMHHNVFGGRSPPEPDGEHSSASRPGFKEWGSRGRNGAEKWKKRRDAHIFQIYNRHCPRQLLKMGSRNLCTASRQLRCSYAPPFEISWLRHWSAVV